MPRNFRGRVAFKVADRQALEMPFHQGIVQVRALAADGFQQAKHSDGILRPTAGGEDCENLVYIVRIRVRIAIVERISHGWTRMNTDRKFNYLCSSVSICG